MNLDLKGKDLKGIKERIDACVCIYQWCLEQFLASRYLSFLALKGLRGGLENKLLL